MGPRHWVDVDLFSCQRAYYQRAYYQRRGAANGKVETSRGRKKSAQEYMGALREGRRKRDIRVKRESLDPLYRKGKRAFEFLLLFS